MHRHRTWLLAGLLAACGSTRTEAFVPGAEVAADIAGVDLDGVAFKLSDYKGKVVLLDFWGDW
ncbi:MAG: hypothetical protein U1E73_01710 [Planctomycetota bacterium]